MKNTPKMVNISEPLWRALEVMSEQMGVDKDALVNQAVYALARMHGFITPPQVKVNDEAPHALDGLPEPMPSVKPGPPVPTPPEPPPTVPERGPMPSPPTMAMPSPPAIAMPSPTLSPPALAPPVMSTPAPAAVQKPEAPQGPSETERAELRAKATEAMKAIAAEVERMVAVQADAPIGDAHEEEEDDDDEDEEQSDDEQEEQDEASEDGAAESAAEEPESPQAEAGALDEVADDEPPADDPSEAPSEENDEPEDEGAAEAAPPNGQLENDLEALGLGEGEEPKSDLSPLPELPEEEQRDEPEGIPTSLVRPDDAVGNAATSLRPKHKKGEDAAALVTMGVHVNVPDRPDGAEEINVTGTVRRLALNIPRDRDDDEPQERTQIVRKEKPRLFITRGGDDPVEIVSERYLIGRGPHCDLVIESNRVSREHAAVFNDDEDGFVVEDLGSSNGTWFKEERVQKHVIADGDEVFFGNEAVRFSLQAPGAGAKRGARRDGRLQA